MAHQHRLCRLSTRTQNVRGYEFPGHGKGWTRRHKDHNYSNPRAYAKARKRLRLQKEGRRNARRHA